MRGNQAPEGQQIEDRAGGLLLEFYRAPFPLRALVSILHAMGVPNDDVWNPAVHWQRRRGSLPNVRNGPASV